MLTRLRHWATGLAALLLLLAPERRALWGEMRAFIRTLPKSLESPLPQALAALTPASPDLVVSNSIIRLLTDAAALFERRSPLGLCLRRSLVRYYFLRRVGVPLTLNFGARFNPSTSLRPRPEPVEGAGSGQSGREVTGHAWVTLNGQPYFEEGENYQGFTVMLKYPDREA